MAEKRISFTRAELVEEIRLAMEVGALIATDSMRSEYALEHVRKYGTSEWIWQAEDFVAVLEARDG